MNNLFSYLAPFVNCAYPVSSFSNFQFLKPFECFVPGQL